MNGPAARRAFDPDHFEAYLAGKSSYVTDGTPRRRRLCINGTPVSESDARMIRRWRTGQIEGITIEAGAALLRRYGLTPRQYAAWCAKLSYPPMLRGILRDSD